MQNMSIGCHDLYTADREFVLKRTVIALICGVVNSDNSQFKSRLS